MQTFSGVTKCFHRCFYIYVLLLLAYRSKCTVSVAAMEESFCACCLFWFLSHQSEYHTCRGVGLLISYTWLCQLLRHLAIKCYTLRFLKCASVSGVPTVLIVIQDDAVMEQSGAISSHQRKGLSEKVIKHEMWSAFFSGQMKKLFHHCCFLCADR